MMTRRDLLHRSLLLGGLGALGGLGGLGGALLGGCTDQRPLPGDPVSPGHIEGDIEYVASKVARAPGDERAGAVAARAVTDFTADLYAQLTRGSTANLVCSPYSVMVVLAMTRIGARGRTATEMDRVLHETPDELDDGLAWLDQQLRGRAGRHTNQFDEPGEVSLAIANSLWGQQGETWEPPFLDDLARSFGTGMRTVDFRTRADAVRRQINGWVEDHTHDKIVDLLPEGSLDPLTRLVLVNAIWFKAPWFEAFEDHATRDRPFTRLDGSTRTAPMMSGMLGSAEYAEGPGWSAASLPYAGRELALAVVVPWAHDGLPDLEASLADGGLARLLGDFRTTGGVDVLLPKWESRTGARLKDALQELGMPTAFTDRADFSGMTRDEQLLIDDAYHQGFIAVDEKGTEAAAATAVVMHATGARLSTHTVHADRPFLHVIHDVATRTPLFIGRVTDPTAR